MWQPSERIFVRYHVIGSLATLVCGFTVVFVSFAPDVFPSMYQLLVDDRIILIIPYLLLIALGESIFSIWYFIFRK